MQRLSSRLGLSWMATLSLVSAAPAQDSQARALPLPAPSGPYPVGTIWQVWTDSARAERLTPDLNDLRRLVVQFWYPAQSAESVPPAPYLPELDWLRAVLTSERARLYEQARVTARANARPRTSDPRPVLVLSHGLGERRTHYTALAEELASHGFFVVGIDHPDIAAAVAYAPNDIVFQDTIWDVLRPPEHPIEELFRLTDQRSEVWAADAAFVLDRLVALNRDGPFQGRLDLERAGALGHSIGGKAAVAACMLDPRFRACANLDGWPIHVDAEAHGLAQPYMYVQDERVLTDDELAAAGVSRQQYESNMRQLQARKDGIMARMRGGGYEVTISGIGHSSFTDFPLLRPDEREAHAFLAPEDGMARIRAVVVAFFHVHLRGGASQPLTAISLPGVSVRAWNVAH